MITSKKKLFKYEYIQEVIGKYFVSNPSDLTSSKDQQITFPRQVQCIYVETLTNVHYLK